MERPVVNGRMPINYHVFKRKDASNVGTLLIVGYPRSSDRARALSIDRRSRHQQSNHFLSTYYCCHLLCLLLLARHFESRRVLTVYNLHRKCLADTVPSRLYYPVWSR